MRFLLAQADRHHHGYHGHYGGYYRLSIADRIRRFFGLPLKSSNVKYEPRTSSWGFLGFSRPRRYTDARTGQEVDRRGRPIYRV